MKTKTFTFTTNTEGENYIKELAYDWTVSFRKLYMNLELQKDENFLNSLRIKNAKLQRDLVSEVLAFDETVKPELKKAGFLTVDSRLKERKKYGQKAARRKFQFTKR